MRKLASTKLVTIFIFLFFNSLRAEEVSSQGEIFFMDSRTKTTIKGCLDENNNILPLRKKFLRIFGRYKAAIRSEGYVKEVQCYEDIICQGQYFYAEGELRYAGLIFEDGTISSAGSTFTNALDVEQVEDDFCPIKNKTFHLADYQPSVYEINEYKGKDFHEAGTTYRPIGIACFEDHYHVRVKDQQTQRPVTYIQYLEGGLRNGFKSYEDYYLVGNAYRYEDGSSFRQE